jgi:hypothetical protein
MRNGQFVIVVAIADAVEQKRPLLHHSSAEEQPGFARPHQVHDLPLKLWDSVGFIFSQILAFKLEENWEV